MQLVYKLHSMGYDNLIIIDNQSTDLITPLFLKNCGYKYWVANKNYGHNVIWDLDILDKFGYKDSYYVYTDCDVIPHDDCPSDFMEVFYNILITFSNIDKVGFGLEYKNLPNHYKRKKDVETWEMQYWISSNVDLKLQVPFYKAAIDTTFALYAPEKSKHSLNAIRTGNPYVAKHLPWYENSSKPYFELENYRKTILPNESSWETPELNKIRLWER